MFVVALRGHLGTRIMIGFHVLILGSGVSLYLIHNSALEILICTVVFIFYVRLIRYMRKHRGSLRFNTPTNELWAFPRVKKVWLVTFFFQLGFVLFMFPAPILLLVLNIPLSSLDGINAFRAFGFWFFYYLGNLTLIGIINHTQQKGELLNDN